MSSRPAYSDLPPPGSLDAPQSGPGLVGQLDLGSGAVHGKRKVVEPDGLLDAYELADRVCGVFGCDHEPHLFIDQEVA